MTFGNPLFLWGMLAALIPVLVHLFDRRRPRPHPFAALAFVLRSQKRTASRLKLRRLILYTLRTLILLAIPLALARPQWQGPTQAATAVKSLAATALILDTSLSMRWRDGGSLFERAQELAREALSELQVEEPATVVLCGPNGGAPPPLSFERRKLRERIDEAQPTFGMADLNRCMEMGARAVEESPLAGKRLVVVSDWTVPSLKLESPGVTVKTAKGESLRPEVILKDAAEGRDELPNRAIVDLKIEPALQVGPRAFQFTFTVRNESSKDLKDLEASLRLNGQVVAKGFVDVAAHGATQKALTHRFEAGGLWTGDVSLSPDGLVEDDVRSFLLSVPRELRALIVNGSPSPVRYRDEAFFVEAALTAPGSPMRASLRDVEAAFKEDLSQFDVVLMLNAPAPTPEQALALKAFVEKGGGLFISMGENVQPEAFNQQMKGLLPRPLRLPKTSAAPEDADVDLRAARLTQVRAEHPVFSVFTDEAREGLLGARFYRHMLLEAQSADEKSSEVLASLDDGAPAVAVAQVGRGRVMLFTSTVDRDWADLSIRTSFLPFMQRCTAWLSGALEEREDVRVVVGQTVPFTAEDKAEGAKVKNPKGDEVGIAWQSDGTGLLGPIDMPGPWQVLDTSGQALEGRGFAAVLDAAESDLTRIKPELLKSHFGEEAVRASKGSSAHREMPLWSWLIVFACCAFIAEGFLLRKS